MSQMLQPSRVAQQTGYRRPNRLERAKAAGLIDVSLFEDADYPAPLVLPNDEIDFDPDYPPQSFSDWQKHITPKSLPFKRTKIYLVPPPGWTEKASFLYRNEWPHRYLLPPGSESIVEYLAAFYDGFEVLQLRKEKLTFDEWIEEGEAEQSQSFVALNTGTESIRIRKRPMPNKGRGFQLNLNDLLDGAIAVLPDDALALILHMDFDLYEDDDDDFVCGRAYGESHVCVVSSFRYSPARDNDIEVDFEHFWPASHCATYVEDQVDKYIEKPATKSGRKGQTEAKISTTEPSMPLRMAIDAYKPSSHRSAWLNRVCRTASHEIGHCLGLDHCMYYACIMQGSATVAEDLRQPPYLCPIDDAKLNTLIATRGNASVGSTACREQALLAFTKRYQQGSGFAAFEAWLEARQKQRANRPSASAEGSPNENTSADVDSSRSKAKKRIVTSSEELRRSKRLASRSC
ncbi:hypothetical protein D6D27_06491 [Aureobasidium pullulans]|nr:hypothetical protein D6D27_06491 [Aureobasidium pullulans]